MSFVKEDYFSLKKFLIEIKVYMLIAIKNKNNTDHITTVNTFTTKKINTT
jgi:hypothetical protein